MRLMNVNTRRLEEFLDDKIPSYAILSHTWGEDEVTFQDLDDPNHTKKSGWYKIDMCCKIAQNAGLDYVWVDTCCIDKKSSAELSEAINSMFSWYKNSQVCYAHLADVEKGKAINEPDSSFRKSRWSTRGWTLQELLAPQDLQFYDKNWSFITTFKSDIP
ncbi:heterokaryon incompatibility protein-domain-containing protein [Xylariaceae sp. FL0016]|nr:heterokaryon incompatibility protein-domain-containing protein [Xylariaceae sp. FL0016]